MWPTVVSRRTSSPCSCDAFNPKTCPSEASGLHYRSVAIRPEFFCSKSVGDPLLMQRRKSIRLERGIAGRPADVRHKLGGVAMTHRRECNRIDDRQMGIFRKDIHYMDLLIDPRVCFVHDAQRYLTAVDECQCGADAVRG